ncbi:MAG: hypothetical protein JWN10_1463, partial [Solirubrobacterales bacterium]|nr:hypothetical protein [Solirubrobacterales bacterium]
MRAARALTAGLLLAVGIGGWQAAQAAGRPSVAITTAHLQTEVNALKASVAALRSQDQSLQTSLVAAENDYST